MSTRNYRNAGIRVTAAIAAVILIATPFSRAAVAGRTPGEQRRWSLRFLTRLEQPGVERPVEIRLSGDWTATVTAVRPGEYDVELGLSGVRIEGEGIPNNSAQAVQQVEQRLARPFWATYRGDGALLSVHFFKDVDPSDRNLLQMVATEAQMVSPNPAEMVWQVVERDGAGSYLAIYNRDERQGVVKRKLKYVQADGQTGLPPGALHVDMDRSELRFALDANGEIALLDGNNRARMGVPLSDQGPMAAVTEIHLANLRRSLAPELIGSLARAASDVASSPIETHKADPEKLQAQRDDHLLEARTTQSLLDAAMEKSDGKSDGDKWLAERLAALFRRRPEAMPAALALLRKSGSGGRIITALASTGSPAAVEALAGLARDSSVPGAVRTDAVTSFIRLHHPTPEAMRIIADLLADPDVQVQAAAYLTSGALARAGRSEHRADADAIDAELIARYRKARSAAELSGLLAALGNSVGPSVLPVIEEALRDPRPAVRAAAARGLRLAGTPQTNGLLSATIAADPDPEVRGAAIFAASFRAPAVPIGEALQRAARGDSTEYVRSKAVSLLLQYPRASPGVSETLAWVAEHDAKPGVRRQARQGLASVSGQHLAP